MDEEGQHGGTFLRDDDVERHLLEQRPEQARPGSLEANGAVARMMAARSMALDEEYPSRCYDLPTDVLVEILRRLLPNPRRRCRLVCRQWRDTVDERTTTDLRSRAKTLLVSKSAAYVLDDKWGVKPLMACTTGRRRVMDVVGTCNGLICFCDDSKPGGAISLANPANGESFDLPPLPCADKFMRGRSRWHTAYGFAHHQGTGRYKVVRIPCCFDTQFDTVQVFTLGETSWRDVVATPAVGCAGTRCLRRAGIVSVDGAVYWVADGTERIMSFDLEAECVTVVKPLPVGADFTWRRCMGGWALQSLMTRRSWRRRGRMCGF
ncbi:hypothetical protein ACQ4PT_061907 [Festuca glaucescens]